ncbi:hypothetical protein BGW38_007062 [Lunasporangiospora selenospora]|uniref:Proteasome activator subunit 4 n=1 Tax=Lunasporangiospora selenospora TaxID=979761 RepID=A0A9P6KIZ6_9FUNG|nr:hypothetical protein BGW38_007062 [Lunasporangiospora selenospora]
MIDSDSNQQWANLSSALHNILPYGKDLEQEASDMLRLINCHFGLCLQSEDWAPGAVYWAKQLNQYLDLKYALPKETRIAYAKVFYELTVAPGMDLALVEIWSQICRRLIKKKQLLEAGDLTLPWKPLYDILERTLFPKSRQRVLLSESFFPPEAPSEILEEFLPQMSTASLADFLKAQSYLCTFLPTNIEGGMDPREWMPTVFRLWSMVVKSSEVDRNFLSLIGRVARDNVGVKDLFTQSQMRTIFSAGLNAMALPVGKGQRTHNVDAEAGVAHKSIGRNDMRLTSFALFIIYTMNPLAESEDPKSNSLAHLTNLIQATESFYHPSNSGPWSYALAIFLHNLAWDLLHRKSEEELSTCKTPMELRLTSDIGIKFVQALKGVTFLTMFSKDQRAVAQTLITLRHLAWIAPKLIIPGVLERAYPSLESLTETHRTTSVISALGSLAVPMLNRDHYPQGGKHLSPLLQLTIPGIDLNDPAKTWYTLLFVTSMISTVPIKDLTETGNAGFQWGGIDEDLMNPEETVDLEFEDSTRKASTAAFEEWLLKFLRRAILMFENYADSTHSEKKDAVEGSITGTISYCFEILFGQLSPKLYDMTTKLVIDLLESAPLTNAEVAMASFVSCWASADRKNAMARAFPILEREIRSEIEHGASSVPSLVHSRLHRDASLHYHQTLLNQLFFSSEFLEHRKEVFDLVKHMIEKCHDHQGYRLTAKAITSMLQNLLFIYCLDIRSYDSSKWNDEAFMSESHLHWGKLGEPGVDSIQWHTPSNEEINFALDLIETILVPTMARARELMTNTMLEGKALAIELNKVISLIEAFAAGMTTLVEDDGDDPQSNASVKEDPLSVQPMERIKVGYCLTDPNDRRTQRVRQIRFEVGTLLHDMMSHFALERIDDVENIKDLVDATRIFLTDHGLDSSTYDSGRKGYEFLKQMYKLPGDKKLYPRLVRCRRAATMHYLRLKTNSFGRAKTELHDALILDLTELSLSLYTDVRKKAQQALTKAVRCHQGAKNLVLPILLKALESDDGPENTKKGFERMKGALFLISTKALTLPCLRDWRYVPEYVMRICRAHHADKPSVQMLVRKCFLEHIVNLTFTSFKALMSSKMSAAIQQFEDLHGIHYSPETLSRAVTKAKDRRLNNIKAYGNLIVDLTELARTPNLHWRYQTMAMSFIEIFMRPDISCSLDIAQFMTKSILSEMPMVRRIALTSLVVVMMDIKTRTNAQGDIYSLIVRKATNPLRRMVTLPEVIPENFTMDYLKSSVTEINYDSPESSLLDDSLSTGWLVWPKSFKAYLPRTNDFVMPEVDSESRPAFDHLEQFFSQSLFWEKLSDYLAQEPVRGERHDAFSSEHARFFKSIFGLWEDKFLDQVEPVVVSLCNRVDDKNAQRTVTEIIGGMIRGSKHWKKESLDKMWLWLTPLLKKTFQLCTPDSLVYWERFVKYCCMYRDPRRILPLITLIFSTPLDRDSTAAFSESKNLFFMRALLVSFSWRVSLLTPSLREDCLKNIAHPYKQVREILGLVINELFQHSSHPSYKSVRALLEDQVAQKDLPSAMVESLDDKSRHQVQELVAQLERWRSERKPSVQGASDYANASKTVLSWVFQALSGFRVKATYGVVIPLVAELFQMQDIPDDQDLQQLATVSLLQLGSFTYPASMVPMITNLFCKLLQGSTSWHIRNNVLPIVQIFFYTNLFSMDVELMVQVMDAVSSMLLDPQIEVRQLAASTLSGIVRCSRRDATQMLIEKFTKLLSSTPLPSRKRNRAGPEKEPIPEGYSDAIVKRHGGVLGLASLLEAFPYEVPKWMPEVMVYLSKFFSDPPPISTTVKKAFGDFKRTHQDTWHEDQKEFEPEQLEILSDMLISPSYYA